MKNSPTTLMDNVRRRIALPLALAVLNLSATVAFASPPGSPVSLGMIRVSGVVTLNDVAALSGETILSGSHIVTASKSNSILELGNFTRMMLSEQTDLALEFSADSISGSLRQGEIRSFIPAARTLSIITPDGVVATDSSQAAVFSVQVETGDTHISVETGRVELRAGKNRRVLGVGETFSTACDSWAGPTSQQNLSKGQKVGIFAGIGGGVAILLVAIIGRDHKEEENFGGCVIILSPIDGGGTCR
jgi:ferric-dicitrate binding protein FerR (iron transport regulator)